MRAGVLAVMVSENRTVSVDVLVQRLAGYCCRCWCDRLHRPFHTNLELLACLHSRTRASDVLERVTESDRIVACVRESFVKTCPPI